MLLNFILVALGSAIGGVLRYAAALGIKEKYAAEVNFAPTFMVNIIGSFIIGVFFVLLSKQVMQQRTGLFLMTGILGGFTTFSGFSLETYRLMENGEIGIAIGYVVGSILMGLLGAYLGIYLTGKLLV